MAVPQELTIDGVAFRNPNTIEVDYIQDNYTVQNRSVAGNLTVDQIIVDKKTRVLNFDYLTASEFSTLEAKSLQKTTTAIAISLATPYTGNNFSYSSCVYSLSGYSEYINGAKIGVKMTIEPA